jgi:hypothetical protein
MRQVFNKIANGLKQRGLRYLLEAPRNELAHPRLGATRLLRRALAAASDLMRPAEKETEIAASSLIFVFDLGVAPVTFDFASYLAAVEVERRARQLASIFVVIVPGGYHGLRKETPDYEETTDVAARHWRVRNLVLPILALLPSVEGHAVFASRGEAARLIPSNSTRLYPSDYRMALPCQPLKRVIFDHAAKGTPIWPMFRATEGARDYIRTFLATVAMGRRPIVISLRMSSNTPERNSKIAEWSAFSRRLDRTRFVPIFVPDTDAAMRGRPLELDDAIFCEAASWSVDLRMALYEAAWLNMAVMHGPMELCWYSETARYVVFLQPLRDTNQIDLMRENGQPLSGNMPFARPFQRIVWDTDRLDVIERAFADMARGIEAI